jgi:hypothetical protein
LLKLSGDGPEPHPTLELQKAVGRDMQARRNHDNVH